MKQTALEVSLNKKEFWLIKHVTGKNDIIDSYPGSGRPHTVHPIAKINKVKDLALI